MKEESGHQLESPNRPESTLKGCDFIGLDNADKHRKSYFCFRRLELKSLR